MTTVSSRSIANNEHDDDDRDVHEVDDGDSDTVEDCVVAETLPVARTRPRIALSRFAHGEVRSEGISPFPN